MDSSLIISNGKSFHYKENNGLHLWQFIMDISIMSALYIFAFRVIYTQCFINILL